MKNDRVSNTTVQTNTPKKLHKPLRQLGELRPEQVVTYGCDDGTDGTGDIGTVAGG